MEQTQLIEAVKDIEVAENANLARFSSEEIKKWLDDHRLEAGEWGTELYYIFSAVQQYQADGEAAKASGKIIETAILAKLPEGDRYTLQYEMS